MTRRFAVSHNLGDDGTPAVARQWRDTRANNPGGGLASPVTDLLRWARFHLGDGRAEDGIAVLPEELLHQMTEPTAELRSSTLGDALGICWFLRDVDADSRAGQAMFTAIIRQYHALGTPVSAARLIRIRATLNAAIRQGLISENPAATAELPRPRGPRAAMWTPSGSGNGGGPGNGLGRGVDRRADRAVSWPRFMGTGCMPPTT